MPKECRSEVGERMSLSQEGESDDDETMLTCAAMNRVVQGRDDQPRRRTVVTSSGMDVNGHIAAGVLMSKYRIDVGRLGSPHTRRSDDADELMFKRGAQMHELSDDSYRTRRRADDVGNHQETGVTMTTMRRRCARCRV